MPEILAASTCLEIGSAFFFWNSVVPSDFLDCDVEVEDPSEYKQKSNSRVVHKQSGGTFWECKLFLQDPAGPDLQAEEVWWTSLLLAVSTHSTHSLCLYADVRLLQTAVHGRLQQGRFKRFTVVAQFERNRHGSVGRWAIDIFKRIF